MRLAFLILYFTLNLFSYDVPAQTITENTKLQCISNFISENPFYFTALISVFVLFLFYLYRRWYQHKLARELKIENLSALLSNSINSVENLIFVKDREFKYLECNTAFENFIGYKRDELIGKDDYSFFSKELADYFRENDKKIFEQEKRLDSIEWTTFSNGEKLYLYTIISPLRNSSGKVIGLVGNSVDLTKQKKLEDELRSSKLQFELFMNNLPYAVVIKDETTKVIYENKNVRNYLTKNATGNTTVENLGKENAQEIDALIKQALKNTKAEKVLQTNIGDKKYVARVLAFTIPQSDGKIYTGIIYMDITDAYTASDEIKKLKSAFERSPVSIMITDSNANITYVNKNYCKVSGYSQEELIGKNPRIVKSGYTTKEQYSKMWKEISSGKVWSSVVKNKAKDGSEFWEDSTILPSFNEDGEIDGYIAFKLEMDEKIHLKEELKNKEELIIAQSRHAAMGEMISMIAHQWRQPISVIAMGANNIILDIELDEIDTKNFKNEAMGILEQTEYLSKTIDDFRNFFRPNNEKEEVNIEKIVDESVNIVRKSLENNDITLFVQNNNTRQRAVYSRELSQVFINILKNAKEALSENTKENRFIKIVLDSDKDNITITICDNGGGVEEQYLSKIFEPYFSTKDERTGTGLGLHMSKTIIEKHLHGTINIKNENGGACFYISLPINKTDAT